MADKFKNKYRSDTVSLQNWNYGSDASYFINVCTLDRILFFEEFRCCKAYTAQAGIFSCDK